MSNQGNTTTNNILTLKDDKLKRSEFLDKLFVLFENFGDQGFAMILNGKYGSGKSTLLNFIKEKNSLANNFDIVTYNAWENNLFDNPLIPILYEISKLQKTSDKVKEHAKQIIKNIPKIFLSTLTNAHSVDITSLTNNDNIFEDYDRYKDSIEKFRSLLTESCKEKKILFMIDELDRCLPEYQIKVLEAVYHLLEIPNLIVIIALDREQLECSIKNKFGDTQNTIGYLSKFINYQVNLPGDNAEYFIQSLMTFECIDNTTEEVKNLLSKFLEIMKFSVRDCKMIIDEINLICKDYSKDFFMLECWYPLLVAFIVIVKYKSEPIYKKWFFREKKPIYIYEDILLKDCTYSKFLEDIKGTDIALIIDYLRNPESQNTTLCRLFLWNLINAFFPVDSIIKEDIIAYTDIDKNDSPYAFHNGFHFPDSINRIIQKVNLFFFDDTSYLKKIQDFCKFD